MSLLRRQLPPELIIDVIEYCVPDGSETLATLCVVSSVFRACGLPVLYRTVYLSTEAQFSCFAKAKYNIDYTRHLSLSLKDTGIPDHAVKRLLDRLPHLERVRFAPHYLPYDCCGPTVFHLHISGYIYSQEWMLYPPRPHVTHLHLENPPTSSGLHEEHIKHLFPALTHVAITSLVCDAANLAKAMRPWLALRGLRRLTVSIVFGDAAHCERALPRLLKDLCDVRYKRAYVHAMGATAPSEEQAKTARKEPRTFLSHQHLRLAIEELGRDAFCGKCDIWGVGTCVWQERSE